MYYCRYNCSHKGFLIEGVCKDNHEKNKCPRRPGATEEEIAAENNRDPHENKKRKKTTTTTTTAMVIRTRKPNCQQQQQQHQQHDNEKYEKYEDENSDSSDDEPERDVFDSTEDEYDTNVNVNVKNNNVADAHDVDTSQEILMVNMISPNTNCWEQQFQTAIQLPEQPYLDQTIDCVDWNDYMPWMKQNPSNPLYFDYMQFRSNLQYQLTEAEFLENSLRHTNMQNYARVTTNVEKTQATISASKELLQQLIQVSQAKLQRCQKLVSGLLPN